MNDIITQPDDRQWIELGEECEACAGRGCEECHDTGLCGEARYNEMAARAAHEYGWVRS